VRWIDHHVKGGLGIMLDDVAAAGYAVLALIAILAISGALGVRN
jgi:phosphatidylglycerophosphatase A